MDRTTKNRVVNALNQAAHLLEGARGASEEERAAALARHTGDDPEDFSAERDGKTFNYGRGNKEWLVLTEDEADEMAAEYIKDSLWAFNASFLIGHMGLPREAEDMIKSHQEKESEGANETFAAMIKDMDDFVDDAIGADGRGHFLSHYDGNEVEDRESGLYIYRTN